MTERPAILLSGSADGWSNYENAIQHAGGTSFGGYCPAADPGYDGLLLCGGGDIDPRRFGQENKGSEEIDPARDAVEFALAEAYLAAGKPVFGICRGHQVLNVALGGALVQDVGPELAPFHVGGAKGMWSRVHTVRAEEGSLLYRFYGQVFSVNSSHHQVVDRLGEGLRVTARAESGLVEGLEHESLPVFSVQFHPERMSYELRRPDAVDGSFLFSEFLRRCIGNK